MTPITLEFIDCWESFHAVLEIRFEGLQGMVKVQKKEYVLQGHATSRDIDTTRCWEREILVGQRIDMSMIFKKISFEREDTDLDADTCPKCQEMSNQRSGLDVKCSVCDLTYRKMIDLNPDPAHIPIPDGTDSERFMSPPVNSERQAEDKQHED